MVNSTLLKVGSFFHDPSGQVYKVLDLQEGIQDPFKGVQIIALQPYYVVMEKGEQILAKPIYLTVPELMFYLGHTEEKPVYETEEKKALLN